MKKLLIMALSLALLTPSSILASEKEIEEFIPEEMELLENEDVEEFPECHLIFVDDTDGSPVQVGESYLNKIDTLGDKTSAYLGDHIYSFIRVLDNYDFVNDLPTVGESDFGSKADPIKIEVTPREENVSISSVDTSKPFYLYGKNPGYGGTYLTFLSGKDVNLKITENKVTIDKNSVETELTKGDPNWRLKTNTFDLSQIFPIKANDKIIAYGLIGVEFEFGSYDEIKNTIVSVDIYDPTSQEESPTIMDTFEVPLYVLCPETPTEETFTIDSNVSKRLTDYINNEGWELSHIQDPKEGGYTFSFKISSSFSKNYPITQTRFKLPGEVKVKFSKTSYISLRLDLDGKPKIDMNRTGADLLSVEELCGNDLILTKEELQNQIYKNHYPLSLEITKFEPINFNEEQVWSRTESFFPYFMLHVTLNPLEDSVRNNTDFEVKFWDNNFWSPIESICKKWEAWFPNSSTVSDFLPYKNIKNYLPNGFEIEEDFLLDADLLSIYNFYGVLVIPVKPTGPYSLKQASMWDWGSNDELGNPQFSLTWKDKYLVKNEDYTVTYARNADKIIATCEGKGSFKGTVNFEFSNHPSYNIRFYDQQANGFLNKEVSLKEGAMTASLSDYLREIPKGYHYVSKPKDLNIDDFRYSENRNQRIASVGIAPTPCTDLEWSFNDNNIKVFVPYRIGGNLAGTLTFGISDIKDNKISKEIITDRLIGYEATQDLILDSSSTSVIGYETRGSYFALEYNANPILVKEANTNNSISETVSVSLGSGTVEIPLEDFKVNNSFTTKNLSELLQKVLKEIAQKVIDSVDSILPSPSEPSPNFLPSYGFVASDEQNLTSKDLDLAGSEQGNIEVKVQVKKDSHILLNFIPTRRKEISTYEVMQDEEMIETASVIRELSLETNSTEEKEIAIVRLEDIAPDQKLNSGTIEEYLQTQKDINKEFNEDFKDYFTEVDFSKAQDLSMINPETGYIEIDIPVVASETTDVPNDPGNSTPNNPTSNSPIKPTQPTPEPEQPSDPTEEPVSPVDPSEPTPENPNPNTPPSPSPTITTKPKPQRPSSTKPEEPTVTNPSSSKGQKKMFRLFNKVTGEHFYTASEEEKNELIAQDEWNDEGQGWISPESSNYPVYRVFNPNSGEHHYTLDENEYKTLVSLGWNDEGIGWYSADDMDPKVTLYRLYNPAAPAQAQHHYTTSVEERDYLLTTGWRDEGIAWYGLKSE